MEVIVQTLQEARQTCSSAKAVCRHKAAKRGHDYDSCACDICVSFRRLSEVGHRLGALDRPTLEEEC